jgi:hypothetical protein
MKGKEPSIILPGIIDEREGAIYNSTGNYG